MRVLKIDFAMPCQCELQREAMGVLWVRGSANCSTCAVYHKSVTETLIFCTDYKGKDKFFTGYFLDAVKTEIIWSDGPSSEFKNQFMHYLTEKLS